MNSVHDMGGMDGLGEIDPTPDPALFHAPWEARVLALVLASAAWGRWTLDTMRFHRERIPAAEAREVFLLYAAMEEEHGLVKNAMAVFIAQY